MSTAPDQHYTPEQYLAFERASELRHEYYRGEVFAMVGASRDHNQVCFNISGELHAALKSGSCRAYSNDMRVKVDATGLYTYPDIVSTCETPKFEPGQQDTLLNPQVIFEVLSDSTEKYDRGDKFTQYRNIESLRVYVLVAQKAARVEVFSRQDDGSWSMRDAAGLDAEITIPTIDVTLQLADIYARVEFKPDDADDGTPNIVVKQRDE